MKLWLLRPADYDQAASSNLAPWNPWYDCTFGYVVRAETETQARQLAAIERRGDEGKDAWLDPTLSSCTELTADGPPAVIISDFWGA